MLHTHQHPQSPPGAEASQMCQLFLQYCSNINWLPINTSLTTHITLIHLAKPFLPISLTFTPFHTCQFLIFTSSNSVGEYGRLLAHYNTVLHTYLSPFSSSFTPAHLHSTPKTHLSHKSFPSCTAHSRTLTVFLISYAQLGLLAITDFFENYLRIINDKLIVKSS